MSLSSPVKPSLIKLELIVKKNISLRISKMSKPLRMEIGSSSYSRIGSDSWSSSLIFIYYFIRMYFLYPSTTESAMVAKKKTTKMMND